MSRKEIFIFIAIFGIVVGIGGAVSADSHDASAVSTAERRSFLVEAENAEGLLSGSIAATRTDRSVLAGGYRGPGLSRKRPSASGKLRRSR